MSDFGAELEAEVERLKAEVERLTREVSEWQAQAMEAEYQLALQALDAEEEEG